MGRLCVTTRTRLPAGTEWGGGGGGRTDDRKGVMQLWALPARRPSGKELFMASTHGQPFEEKSWEGSRKEAPSLYAASLRQLQTSFSQKKNVFVFCKPGPPWYLVFSNISILVSFAPDIDVYLRGLCLCLSHPATWLLWQQHTKWRQGAWELEGREWKPFSNRSRLRHGESQEFLSLVNK